MEVFLFFMRHIPFWAIPLGLVCIEVAILFWLKQKKKKFWITVALAFVLLGFVVFYYWVGGPTHVVKFFTEMDI